MRVRLDLAYDGSAFAGWARQPGQRTVQGLLEAGLATVLRLDPPVAVTVAGRTDAGVHARGQVCHLDVRADAWAALATSRRASGPALVRRLGGVLAPDVLVRAASLAPPGFDARFSAIARRYAYRIVDEPAGGDPLSRHFVVAYPRALDAAAMQRAAALLLGEHDFAAYCRRRDGATTIRTLLRLGCARSGGTYDTASPDAQDGPGTVVIDVEADAFCHQMVRSLVGALVAVGDGRRPVAWPGALLARTERESAVSVMPAHGLTLEEVRYPADDELRSRAIQTRAVRQLGTSAESGAH